MIDNDTMMGYIYVSESLNDDSTLAIKNMDVTNSNSLFYVTFEANLQDFDVMNRNQRYYDADNIWECIQSEKIQSLLKSGGWFGEFEHPAPLIQGEKLSPERIQNVLPEKRAFKIMNPKIIGNTLTAKIQSAQGPVGEGFGKEVLAGWVPQFSARAIAHMISKNGKPYVMVKRLITYDAPWYPSHKRAHMTSNAKVTSEPILATESVNESDISSLIYGTSNIDVNDIINGVTVSLKEILEDVGKTDINAELIMEAFDLSPENMIGFDTSKRHVIMRDENNIIYANINPNTVKKVNDFYSSF